MTSHPRRDDRSTADPFKQQWDKFPTDHRRNRSATLPANPYDQRAYPPHDTRYNDPRQSSRPHRQDPIYPSSYHHHASAQPPPVSKTYQHATRPSAQHPSAAYPPQPSSVYPVASSSRRPHADAPDPRASRRPPPSTHQPYDQVSSGEEMPRASKHPSRAQPPLTAQSNHAYWNPTREVPPRRHKDPYRDQGDRERDRERGGERERERDRDRERDRPTADLENRHKDRTRSDRHRERERERPPDVRYQEPTRTRHHDRRKDPDTEGVVYPEQRNASRTSLSGREGYPSVREPSSGHRRHRTEDGITSVARRHQPENTQNPITTMPPQSASVPQPEVQQTGEPPPPAPRVMPVHLPPKAKSQRPHRDGRTSNTQGVQPGSDTERATGKYRMERIPSGPAVQRSDAHASSSTRDRVNHDITMGPRDDVRRTEGKHGVHQDAREPLTQINVDIPLVTPGFNASSLPPLTRASTVPQIVSIRAGQGPSDPHDPHLKSSAISHSDAPQEIATHPLPHLTSASIIKPSGGRSQSFDTRVQSDRPVVLEPPRVELHADDSPPGQRMLTRESSRPVPSQISKSHSYARGNTETGVDQSYPHSRPPSRSAHRTSNNAVPPAVVGPRPLRSTSQGPPTNEPTTRPPSVAQHPSTVPPVLNQHSVPPSPAYPTQSSHPKAGHTHSTSSSAQPSPKNVQLHGVSLTYSTSAQPAPSAPPSIHPTPAIVPQTLTASSRPPTRDSTHTDAPRTLPQSADRQPVVDSRPGSQHAPNSTTVKASWVVQTPATARRAKISREEKYLRDNQFNSDTPRAQLRQVLSQDDDSYPRVSSLMMKASQATTPSATSQRNSQARDVPFGTPRGTLASNSPKSAVVKETYTPEYVSRQNSSPHLAGPPQIAVVGATPDSIVRDLPQSRVDHALLAPAFPAPTLVSRTTSSSQDQQPQPLQPVVRDISSASYQPQPALAVHAPSLFQPYRSPSLPSAEDHGQSSPPPLPIPPPRSPDDSPPPPIERRTSEIIPARSQADGVSQSYGHSVPEVQSEMFHIPLQPSASSQPSSFTLPRTPQVLQAGKPDNAVPTPVSNRFMGVAHADVGPIPVLPSQSSASSTRSRPKVTIEDVPEDSPELSKAIPMNVPTTTSLVPSSRPQALHHSNTNPSSKAVVEDQPSHKPSPQMKNKDSPPHRSTDPGVMPIFPSMPPPTSTAAPTSTRMPSSAPPTHPTFAAPAQAVPTQRATSHVVSSRTHQRAAEMLQASKLSPATNNPGVSGSVSKSAAAPVQTTHHPASNVTGQNQPVNGASVQGSSVSRVANMSTTMPHPSTPATATTTKVAAHTTSGAGPSVGALHMSAPSISINTQLPSAPDRQQPSRPGVLSIPTLDTTSLMPSAVKNVHQEQAIVDSTRTRDVTPSATRHLAPSSHVYNPSSTRPGASSATTQQTHVAPAQPPAHNRVVSLPVASSSTVQRPLSPRKYSQPLPSTTVSTQPFPSRPSASESQSIRVPASGHVVTPTPARLTRPPPPDRHDSDILKTPSSIAPSPMLNSDTSNAIPQSATIPTRARKPSTESKDDDKKPSGLFRLFRTRTISSKAVDPPVVSTATRTSLDQGRTHPDASGVASTSTSAPRGVTSTTTPKEWNSGTQPATSTRAGPAPKLKGSAAEPIAMHPPPTQATREHRDTPHIFTPFKFLHSKRNRTVSAASLDVCDGNTATNTVIGSPDHSAVGQAQPLPHIIPPGTRDPMIAASEWRDREEAERRERRINRIRRPGVTFDLEEEPPSPAPGTAKRKRLVRRPSGRAPTPAPARG